MPHDDLLLAVAMQRMHDDHTRAERHRLVGTRRLTFLAVRFRLDWRVVREHRVLVAGIGLSWRRAPG
ncbi:hypothetical protein [Saccharothrix sp. NRRL B-16314]|uniref:hypothetical protein n=1 Tax=Saccharothrix sp. NRRL B-16314 TaxID=1463825 RepID=UPI000525CB85|nr:hypothetical protein [Saccharothrix sp. NRRL B-16314]